MNWLDFEEPLLVIFYWFAMICTFIVLQKIARNAFGRLKVWHRERRKYKLPKPPDTYRLN